MDLGDTSEFERARILSEFKKEIRNVQNHVIILGYNERVPQIIRELHGEGVQGEDISVVIVAESVFENRSILSWEHVYWLSFPPTSVEIFPYLKLERARAVLVVVQRDGLSEEEGGGSADAETVLTVIALERFLSHHLSDLTIRPRIIAECLDENSLEHLKNAGCDEVVMIGNTTASLLSASVINPGITDFFAEVFSTQRGHEFYIVSAPKSFYNLSFFQAFKRIKLRYGDILVAVKRGDFIRVNPRQLVILPGDELVVLAKQRPSYK